MSSCGDGSEQQQQQQQQQQLDEESEAIPLKFQINLIRIHVLYLIQPLNNNRAVGCKAEEDNMKKDEGKDLRSDGVLQSTAYLICFDSLKLMKGTQKFCIGILLKT